MNGYVIAVDAMGGDNAPRAIIEGCRRAVRKFPDVSILLCGPKAMILPMLGQEERIEILEAPDVIGMHEQPMLAVRKKTESSLVKAMLAVREGRAGAVVSAGSTGAILAGGILRVGRIPGIERPALAPIIPGANKPFLLIDCGANVDCQAKYLLQFGLMGSVYMQSVMGVQVPQVGLCNIGTEAEKGDRLTKEAYGLFSEQKIFSFAGNAEVRDVPTGDFDVVVCDGFVGNVLLKTIEGTAKLMMGNLRTYVRSSLRTKIGALLLKPALYRLKADLDYKRHGGAPLLGVNGAVVKAHGSSDGEAIENAIRQARLMLEGRVVEKIREGLKEDEEDVL